MIDTKRQTVIQGEWVEVSEQRSLAPVAPNLPTHAPVRLAQTAPASPAVPALPRGLLPYAAAYFSGWSGTMDPAQFRVIDRCGGVYLVGVQLVAQPDPVVPMLGFGRWTLADLREFGGTPQRVAGATRGVVDALAMYSGWARAWWKAARYPQLATDVNYILGACAELDWLTDAEYAFIEYHLVGACRQPGRYAR